MKNTKTKLLETAAQMFAEYGFDGVSTRDLVAMSGVNLCTINYYFGSKQKLYDAVIESIVANVNTNLVAKVDKFISEHDASTLDYLLYSIDTFFDYLFSNQVSNYMALIAIREFLMPDVCEHKIFTQIIEPLRDRMIKMIVDITGCVKQQAHIRAHCLVSQVFSLRLVKNSLHYSDNFLKNAKLQIIENCKILLSKENVCLKK